MIGTAGALPTAVTRGGDGDRRIGRLGRGWARDGRETKLPAGYRRKTGAQACSRMTCYTSAAVCDLQVIPGKPRRAQGRACPTGRLVQRTRIRCTSRVLRVRPPAPRAPVVLSLLLIVPPLVAQAPPVTRDSVTVVPGPQFSTTSWIRWLATPLFGARYRQLWRTPITLPVLDVLRHRRRAPGGRRRDGPRIRRPLPRGGGRRALGLLAAGPHRSPGAPDHHPVQRERGTRHRPHQRPEPGGSAGGRRAGRGGGCSESGRVARGAACRIPCWDRTRGRYVGQARVPDAKGSDRRRRLPRGRRSGRRRDLAGDAAPRPREFRRAGGRPRGPAGAPVQCVHREPQSGIPGLALGGGAPPSRESPGAPSDCSGKPHWPGTTAS